MLMAIYRSDTSKPAKITNRAITWAAPRQCQHPAKVVLPRSYHCSWFNPPLHVPRSPSPVDGFAQIWCGMSLTKSAVPVFDDSFIGLDSERVKFRHFRWLQVSPLRLAALRAASRVTASTCRLSYIVISLKCCPQIGIFSSVYVCEVIGNKLTNSRLY